MKRSLLASAPFAPSALVALVLAHAQTACAPAPSASAPTPAAPASPAADIEADKRTIAAELDDWHAAAAQANEARYFGHFAKDAIFLGTDAAEHWDVPAFRAFARPYFEKGKAWTFRATKRTIRLAPGGQSAWFDEDLETSSLGPSRGSGVLVREDGRWKITQYDLSIPIPNERLSELRALLEGPPKPRSKERYKEVYAKASALAESDLPGAAKLLADMVPEAKTHPDEDLEFWLHNELTWLHWAQDDLPGALAEVDAMRATLDHGTLSPDATATLRLHERWDRAYILLEMALTGPRDKRTKALAEANAARTSYETLAKARDDRDGLTALDTFFAVRLGKSKEALASAKKVDLTQRGDVQDLYIFQLAYEAGGDKQSANAARTQICRAKNYLMRPLILHRGAKEGWRC
ncbi:nuclear transport factor 2 family protein [Pendulispora albinea]|uniref:Nuclear transport factor 2 family protein n=1 Tax=Pendulispora albinea TaxID=2741071 RepID=A0ABZ2LVV5_9BACT